MAPYEHADRVPDVMIVDDNRPYAKLVLQLLRIKGRTSVHFDTPREAEEYLATGKAPRCMLVDMRIPCDLGGSERLFYLARGRGLGSAFTFITGNRSEHDEQVLSRTGARCIVKRDLHASIDKLLGELSVDDTGAPQIYQVVA